MHSKKTTSAGKHIKDKDGHRFDWIDGIFLVLVIGLPCLIVYLVTKG